VVEHDSFKNFQFWPLRCLAPEFKALTAHGELGKCVVTPGSAVAHLRWGDLQNSAESYTKVDSAVNVAKFVSAYNEKHGDEGVTVLAESYAQDYIEGSHGPHTLLTTGTVWDTFRLMCQAEVLYSAGSGIAMAARVLGDNHEIVVPPKYLTYTGLRLTDDADFIDLNEYAAGTAYRDMPFTNMTWKQD